MSKAPLHNLSPREAFEDSTLLRVLMDVLPDCIYVKDVQGRYVFSNVAHTQRLGVAGPEEIVGKSDLDFYSKELAERYRAEEHEIVVRSGQSLIDREESSVDEEGNRRWSATTKVPLRNGDGEIVWLLGISRDVTRQKETEDALCKSEERFRSLSASSPLGIFLTDAEGRCVYTNPILQEICSFSHEEALGEGYAWFIHPEDRERAVADWTRQAMAGREWHQEYRFLRPDRGVRWVSVRTAPISRDHEIIGHVGTVEDITERKRAEEKLRESEKRFRSLIQNASDVITILDKGGNICYESPAVERVLGYRPEERVGENTFDYFHPDDRKLAEDNFAAALGTPGQSARPVELWLRHKNGSWRCVETIRTNLLDDPAVKGLVANYRDITQRKRAEERLKESEERHRAVVEQSVEGIYLFDPDDGRILESNEAFQELLGYAADELPEMTIYDFIAHEREDIDRNVRRDHTERRRDKGERKYRRKDGSLLSVEASAAVVPYGDEEAVCCVVHTTLPSARRPR